VRPRDPRRLIRRWRLARARVELTDAPASGSSEEQGVTTRQCARVTLPKAELDRVWSPEYLERLARTYWAYLSKVSLGLLRVVYTAEGREVVLLGRPLRLLTFHKPEYDTAPDRGEVTWRIKRGVLVAPRGRDHGFLRLAVRREPGERSHEVVAHVSSEVANFYPLIAGWGWFSEFGRWLYRVTQLRIHIVVTHGFLRSLANLELVPSKVGALRAEQVPEGEHEMSARSAQAARSGSGRPGEEAA
jgi:hypothetical protein